MGFRMELVKGAMPICEGSCCLTSLERQEVLNDCRSCKVRVGSNGNLLWEASVLLGRKKGGVRVARDDDHGVTEGREDVREVLQQRGSGAKRKLSRCGRNQMGNEPILALLLPEGARRVLCYHGVGRRSEAKNEFEIDVRRFDLEYSFDGVYGVSKSMVVGIPRLFLTSFLDDGRGSGSQMCLLVLSCCVADCTLVGCVMPREGKSLDEIFSRAGDTVTNHDLRRYLRVDSAYSLIFTTRVSAIVNFGFIQGSKGSAEKVEDGVEGCKFKGYYFWDLLQELITETIVYRLFGVEVDFHGAQCLIEDEDFVKRLRSTHNQQYKFGVTEIHDLNFRGSFDFIRLYDEVRARTLFVLSSSNRGRLLGIIDLMRQKNKRMKQEGLI
ncbi:hypothetical protein Tco_0436151 [Tanacetum coccineum]